MRGYDEGGINQAENVYQGAAKVKWRPKRIPGLELDFLGKEIYRWYLSGTECLSASSDIAYKGRMQFFPWFFNQIQSI